MALLLDAVVAFLQIALLAFLAWGGWLAVRSELPEVRLGRAAVRMRRSIGHVAGQHDFERVASLVLLALLLTTSLALV